MIIGIVGLIGSGKDTIADYLVNYHGFRRESFASTLKDSVAAIFGWDRVLLEGRTKESREWREQIDQWWAKKLNIPHLTPRWVLQQWGTDVCRRAFHDDIWIASLEHKLLKTHDDVVITDCRFPNEISSIKQAGGVIFRTQRGPDPEWMEYAKAFMRGEKEINWLLSKHELITRNIHASEYSWAATEFDAILDNNSTIENLYQQVEHQLSLLTVGAD